MHSTAGATLAVLASLGTALAASNERVLGAVEAPLGGYQYVPVGDVTADVTGKGAESSAWLQGSSNCNNAIVSSSQYFASPEFASDAKDSASFYASLLPVVNGTFNSSTATFKNAYTIWDLINVATIHNSSIPSDSLLTKETLSRSFNLASRHEWNLAYNASDPVRAMAGAVLAGQILDALQLVVNGTASSPKLNVQFGAYGAFMAFFGLAQLQNDYSDFYGVTDYASSMAFEVFTTSTDSKPSTNDIQVRFLYSNGTASETNLKQFNLFGKDTQSWSDFQSSMSKFAITSTDQWCKMCGGNSGQCAASSSTNQGDSNAQTTSSHGNGISKAVAGVIGALVTLGVILGLELLVMVVGGIRLVRKRKARSVDGGSENGSAHKAN
ncbi:hypothetical protein LLEC1_04472 [Akanthomyces lecanii]|uniref:Heme haloperoxidase family profile domain-containing protein n=1 Tax=Cordyceps confragosa TaxID=2714763 RepID=A0A179I8G4_CORDF|nr:hypothetical protein LLEC1_04472 [Akanthomyces lecanii]